MIAPLSRIVLRYLAGFLVAYGVITPDIGQILITDPDIIAIVGVVLGAIVESFYVIARKYGWSK